MVKSIVRYSVFTGLLGPLVGLNAVKEEKGVGWQELSHGYAKQNSQFTTWAVPLNSSKRLGKTPGSVQTLPPDSCQNTAIDGQPENQCRNTNPHQSQLQAKWHHDLLGWLTHKGPVWSGVQLNKPTVIGQVESRMCCPDRHTAMQSSDAKAAVDLLPWPHWNQRE